MECTKSQDISAFTQEKELVMKNKTKTLQMAMHILSIENEF